MTADQTGDHERDAARTYRGRFQPGRSGNPKGRPKKKAATLPAAVARAQKATVEVTEGGRRRRVTKAKLAAMQLANKAAAGDLASIRLMSQIGLDERSEEDTRPVVLTASDLEIVERLIARIRAAVLGEGVG